MSTRDKKKKARKIKAKVSGKKIGATKATRAAPSLLDQLRGKGKGARVRAKAKARGAAKATRKARDPKLPKPQPAEVAQDLASHDPDFADDHATTEGMPEPPTDGDPDPTRRSAHTHYTNEDDRLRYAKMARRYRQDRVAV